MFDLPLRCQLLQGPVVRTWNCVTNFANLLWYKFYHIGYLTMPRSRRRHHSRSRTRSRSNSVERTRDVKRRKIDSYEETHKRSLSSETVEPDEVVTTTEKMETSTITEDSKIVIASEESDNLEKSQESVASSSANDESKSDCETVKSTDSKDAQSLPSKLKTSEITPKKALSPLQLKKRLESAKRREEKEKEREEKRLKLLEEKKLMRDEKEKQRLEKQEQKQKELEMKEDKRKKEQEEKDMKRKEKEEKIEQKRKEIEEKKQKEENKKQKISAAFVNFFTKKPEAPLEKKVETVLSSTFMPFEVKSDMRLAPLCRKHLSDEQKKHCLISIKQQDCAKTYLEELKNGKEIGTDAKTWIDDEVDTEVIIVEDLGESIVHQTDSTQKWRAKFLKFHENRRPAYYGTWRKKSKVITPTKPFSVDEDFFNYDADSDDDWEEEEPGESVGGSDDEEKDEPEIDYDYDNFLVPHGYLSDSEVNDEENSVANPEDHKLKLKILKKEFDDEMNEKAHKLKPRMIGCIWYNKNEKNVDENTHSFLKPYFIIAREQIKIKKRFANEVSNVKPSTKSSPKSIANPLEEELIPEFLKFIHGRSVSQKTLIKEYLKTLKDKGIHSEASQKSLQLQLRTLAEWKRSQNKFCWCVRETVMKDYKVELPHV